MTTCYMKHKPLLIILILASLWAISSCRPSTDQVAKEVRQYIIEDFAEKGFSEYIDSIGHLVVVHVSNNNYEGVLDVVIDNETYKLPVHIVRDNKNTMYEVDTQDIKPILLIEAISNFLGGE